MPRPDKMIMNKNSSANRVYDVPGNFSQIALLDSDSEGENAAPFVVDASLAGWQQQDPNAGASAFQVCGWMGGC